MNQNFVLSISYEMKIFLENSGICFKKMLTHVLLNRKSFQMVLASGGKVVGQDLDRGKV